MTRSKLPFGKSRSETSPSIQACLTVCGCLSVILVNLKPPGSGMRGAIEFVIRLCAAPSVGFSVCKTFAQRDRGAKDAPVTARSGGSLLGQGPDCTQLIRIKPYSAAGRALVYHDRLLGAETSSHHCNIRIPWTLQSRRRGNQ
jgi:hypothetical protein